MRSTPPPALPLAEWRAPGAAYTHFTADRVITEQYAGMADVASARPVNADTSFHGFSVTKTITALAVLQLVRDGHFALETPVKELLPTMPYAGDIRVHHLLSHQAGLPNPLPLSWVHGPNERSFDRDAFFAAVFKKSPRTRWAPGERFAYSNLGYVLLGQLIERVSGDPYEAYVHQRILAPAGVHEGALSFTYPSAGQHATGYLRSPSLIAFVRPFLVNTRTMLGAKHGQWRSFEPFLLNGAAYGGTLGTAAGYRTYLQALMRGSLIDEAGKALLFAEQRTRSGDRTGMAMGWFVGSLRGEPYVAHAGGGGGYYAELRIYPDRGLGSVLLLNRTGLRDEHLLDHIDPVQNQQR